MTRLLQLSDLHVRARPLAHENRHLRNVVANLVRTYNDGDKPIVVITGDITQNGHPREYENALAILGTLKTAGFELFIVPGNHDVAVRGHMFRKKAQLRFQRKILGELMGLTQAQQDTCVMDQLYPLVRTYNNVRIIGLDSANSSTFVATGEIGKPQLDKLAAELMAPRGDCERVVICLHHHPFYREVGHRLNDSAALQKAVYGRAHVVMFGHRHRSERWRDKLGVPIVYASGQTNAPTRRQVADGRTRVYEVRGVDIDAEGKLSGRVDLFPCK